MARIKKVESSFVATKDEIRINKKCLLARNGMFPYQRCDYCTLSSERKCTGMQYNILVVFISLLLMLFLFVDNPIFYSF